MASKQRKSVELVHRAQEGDGQALNELFTRYNERIHRIASVRMGRHIRPFMDSMDLVQSTFVVAFKEIDRFKMRSESSIIHWLSKILENQIRNAARYARADCRDAGQVQPLQTESRELPLPAKSQLPIDEVSDRELRDLYDESLSTLSEENREVILLRDYAGMSWDSISRELDRPGPSAARALYQRAKLALSEAFDRKTGRGERPERK